MRVYDSEIRAVREHSYSRGNEVEIELEDGRAIIVKIGDGYNHPNGGALIELLDDVSNGNEQPSDSTTVRPSE